MEIACVSCGFILGGFCFLYKYEYKRDVVYGGKLLYILRLVLRCPQYHVRYVMGFEYICVCWFVVDVILGFGV